MSWLQREIVLKPKARGCHLITNDILRSIPELESMSHGLLHLFLLHTSASLTINENADPDVLTDLEMAGSRFVSEDLPFQHTMEGPDDMPAHVKTALFGHQLTIPISEGRLKLGAWQGIYLWEHRNEAPSRKVFLTIMYQ